MDVLRFPPPQILIVCYHFKIHFHSPLQLDIVPKQHIFPVVNLAVELSWILFLIVAATFLSILATEE